MGPKSIKLPYSIMNLNKYPRLGKQCQKKWNLKQKYTKWMPWKVCINKCCFVHYFSLLMSINYESIYQSKLSMISPIIHNSKNLKIDGHYLCKTIFDHYIYVYKKPIIIIKHRSGHKFQMCKEDGLTNFKFDYTTTWFIYKIGFYEICKSKTCHFLKIMPIRPYSISSN